jgi:hypothetical protein
MRSLGKARIRELIDDPTRANPNTVMPRSATIASSRVPRSTASWSTCMRFRNAVLAIAIACAAPAWADAPEQARAEMAAALRERLPDTPEAQYALGAAAFDPELKGAIEQNASAGAAAVDAGKALWTRKFKDGRTLAGCFPMAGGAWPRATRSSIRA